MEDHLLMDISKGGLLFQLFYILAFVVAYTILVYEGYRRKFNILSWILLLASVRLAVVIGTKLFTFSWEDWRYMFQNHALILNQKKTLFGGVLMGVLIYFAAKRILHFRQPVWDALAYVLPVAVSVQSLGCFFYGCCFGAPSELPWAVRYPVMSLAHYHQYVSGLLTYQDIYSLPVHPVQLYESLGGILVVILMTLFRKRWKAAGSFLLSSLILYAVMRFGIEFFRDPLSNKTGGELVWILKKVQWYYLAFATMMILVLIWREKNFKLVILTGQDIRPDLHTDMAFLFTLVLIFFLLYKWFTIPEMIAVNIALLPAVFLVGLDIFRSFASLRFKWVYAFALLLPPVLMSQTLPQSQIGQARDKKYNHYHTVGSGFATGSYTDERTTQTGSGCDAVLNTQYFSHKYKTGGAGYTFSKETPDKSETITYGISVNLGRYRQKNQTLNQETSRFLFDANPFIKYDTRWIGIGGGLHLGNLVYTTGDTHRETTDVPENGFIRTPIFPQFYFRVGVKKFFYGDFHLADQFPVSAPGMVFQAGFGSGFGLNNGMNLRFGANYGSNLHPIFSSDLFVSAYLPFGNGLIMEPLFQWTLNGVKNGYPVDLPDKQFSIGLSYRFGNNK